MVPCTSHQSTGCKHMLFVALCRAAETQPPPLQELSAAQRKRLKKKAKAKGGKAEPADEEPAEDTSSKKAGGKKAGGKAVSAAVRKMQEQVEARRAAEEAARLAEEERIRKVGLRLVTGCPARAWYLPSQLAGMMWVLSRLAQHAARGQWEWPSLCVAHTTPASRCAADKRQ